MKQLHRCAHCFLSGASDYMKPATQFGVFTEADILPKLVSQGAWARCEVCRQLANSKRRESGLPLLDTSGAVECAAADGLLCSGPCGLTRPRAYFSVSAVKKEKRNKTQTCNFCLRLVMCADCCKWIEAKHFPLQGPACVACAQVTCASCGETKAQSDFRKSDVKHYFYNKQNVSCKNCRESSESPWKGSFRSQGLNMNKCEACSETKPQSMFRKMKGSWSAVCKSCEQISCAGCKRLLATSCFEEGVVSNHFKHSQNAICLECKNLGRSYQDLRLYKCQGQCGKLLGHQKFNLKQVQNFNNRGGQLKCAICSKEEERRQQRLEDLLKTSKQRCKCGKPIHTDRCPLSSMNNKGRPWEGGDVMGREDADWLANRKKCKLRK